MNASTATKNKINPRNILGGIPGLFEDSEFESESSIISSATHGVGGIFQDIFSLVGENIAGIEDKSSSETQGDKLSIGGQTELKFNENQAKAAEEKRLEKEAARKRIFFQSLKEDQARAQQAKDKILFEEEINDISTNMSTEDKNRMLHYQSSYKDRSIYQKAELRKKIIEERRKAEKDQKSASIPSPAKQPSALEGAFEGRSGTTGSGTANLSNQATG